MSPIEGESDTAATNTTDSRGPLHYGDRDRQPSSLMRRLRQWLVASVDSENPKLKRRRRLVAVSFLVAVVGYLRYSKKRRQESITATARPSSLSTTSLVWSSLTLLSSFWKGPDYQQSPQESPMSLLWNAAKEGIIQQALIGPNSVFFLTRQAGGTMKWNRTILPDNESIKSGLLEALAAAGCKDIQALPESIWSKLATPILAALPFVYLAILYRMMKNQFGGEDISSRLINGTRKLLGEEEQDRTTFADVAGLDAVVEDIREIVSYIEDPSLYTGLGARPPRGVLLNGPPGSGSKCPFFLLLTFKLLCVSSFSYGLLKNHIFVNKSF